MAQSSTGAPLFYVVNQHIGWLKQYVFGMDENNWRDMRDRAESQLKQLSQEIDKEAAAIRGVAQQPLAPCPYDSDSMECLLETHSIGPCLCANPVAAPQPVGNTLDENEIDASGAPHSGIRGIAYAPMDNAAGIEWFERTFGVPLGDKPGAVDVERVRASVPPASLGGEAK